MRLAMKQCDVRRSSHGQPVKTSCWSLFGGNKTIIGTAVQNVQRVVRGSKQRLPVNHAFRQRSFFAPVNDECKSTEIFAAGNAVVLQIADGYTMSVPCSCL